MNITGLRWQGEVGGRGVRQILFQTEQTAAYSCMEGGRQHHLFSLLLVYLIEATGPVLSPSKGPLSKPVQLLFTARVHINQKVVYIYGASGTKLH
jgi:hypothetical protein